MHMRIGDKRTKTSRRTILPPTLIQQRMIEGNWTPLSEEEKELMEELFVVTREANKNGVSKVRIAGLLSFMASGAIDPQSFDGDDVSIESDGDTLQEHFSRENESQAVLCPVCEEEGEETEIVDVTSQLGGQLYIKPCGHMVEWDERDKLGDWAEKFDPTED